MMVLRVSPQLCAYWSTALEPFGGIEKHVCSLLLKGQERVLTLLNSQHRQERAGP